ncbi:glycoside hydrolase family protein [Sphingobacterium faecale]|uniref:Glycosyl hydrolase family 32 N-terminal domain-containing protein n=1 Tax=Sphingobacterium faecale TaxID=2803775 RepID=A0ABS1R9T4_9SPHI|nr:hypothetical protein [Sphingobacterium faecale]MBL1411466.1 hypothetical protein [Sphingobacterium faecale]
MNTITKSYTLLAMIFVYSCSDKLIIPEVEKTNGGNVTPAVPSLPLSSNMIKYRPYAFNMWDSWAIVKDDSIHLFHLQYTRDDIDYGGKNMNLRGFGHATSGNLLTWNEQKEVLDLHSGVYTNDQDFRYTGCTILHNGTYYMYYTMRKWGMQRIGLATSTDLYNWQLHANNPVLEPDPAWFISFNAQGTGSNDPLWGDIVDCRDMVVIKDPSGNGFWGYFIAAANRSTLGSPTTVVGVAYSTDLINWMQKGIAYQPDGIAMPEMIDVFEMDGVWYMTLTTGKNNGSINLFSDPYISRAIIYAKSNTPDGLFSENFSDNVVMGGSINSGYSMRSLLYKGKRRAMYVDVNNGPSVLSLPKNVVVKNNKLRLEYASDLMPQIRRAPTSGNIEIHSQPNTSFGWWPLKGGNWTQNGTVLSCTTANNSWQGMLLKGAMDNRELVFTVDHSSCKSYGIILSKNLTAPGLNDIPHILVIEPDKNRLYLTSNIWDVTNIRSYDFSANSIYTYRMVLMGDTFELYINDELAFNSGLSNGKNYLAGLFANSGEITVRDIETYELW